MRYLYTAVLYLIYPFIIFRLYLKSRRLPAYSQRLKERFSLGSMPFNPVDVWVHAVSLGEVVAATPLIQALLDKGLSIVVTTMTPTGSQQIVKRFDSQVAHQYVPYDFPWALRRFLTKFKPKLVIIMETELWPNLIFEVNRANISLLLVNARLSDRAFKQYMKARFIFKPLLNQFSRILSQSDEDARRFIALGASLESVQVGGNLKFDVPLIELQSESCTIFSDQWGATRTVVIAASTHDDEESQILMNLSKLRAAIPGVLLLIAPRHPERFQDVYQLSLRYGYKTVLRSMPETVTPLVEVIVLDSLGELTLFYTLCDYAFVGGSLVPVGGHNVLEPIAAKVPVFCGPFMNNSKSICDDFMKVSGIERVINSDDLIQKMIALHQDPVRRELQISNATAVLRLNQGALQKCIECVEGLMG